MRRIISLLLILIIIIIFFLFYTYDYGSIVKIKNTIVGKKNKISHNRYFLSEPKDFNGAIFGNDIFDIQNIKLLLEGKCGNRYVRNNDIKKFCGVNIELVYYDTMNDKLACVYVKYIGVNSFNNIYNALINLHGKYSSHFENKINKADHLYYWIGKNIKICLSYIKDEDFGWISYFYIPLAESKQYQDCITIDDSKLFESVP